MNEPDKNKTKTESEWINTILELLKDTDSESGKNLLEGCGRKCFEDSGVLKRAKELKQHTEGLTDSEVLALIQKNIFTQEEGAPRIHKQDGMIYLEYSRCMCRLNTGEGQYDDFLCECTKGFAKSLMEAVFNKSADVTILKTILRGDDSCLLAIRLL